MSARIKDRVLQIGGEQYALHILSLEELKGYLTMVRRSPLLKEFLEGFKDMPLIQYPPTFGSDKTLLYFYEQMVNEDLFPAENRRIATLDYKGTYQLQTDNSTVCWMPALIPLDADGLPMTDRFKRDNPNGSVIRGLYYLGNKKTHGLARMSDSAPFLNGLCNTDLEFVEDDDDIDGIDPIEWIAYEGMLIPRRGLCNIQFGRLYQLLRLPVALRYK